MTENPSKKLRLCAETSRVSGLLLAPLAAALVVFQALVMMPLSSAVADSSSPLLSAYYNRQMAIVDGVAFTWMHTDEPVKVTDGAVQVGVGRDRYHVLTRAAELLSYQEGRTKPTRRLADVVQFSAGQSGVLFIKHDHSLWWIETGESEPKKISEDVEAAAVGDGTNYFISRSGALFVKGKSHRGQYGDGKLKSTTAYIRTASEVAEIRAHTGHAILRKTNDEVYGTGGNIYGPVGRHGLGDKADRWSKIIGGVGAIATGSSHSAAIRNDATLLVWGRGYTVEPLPLMGDVIAVAAGSSVMLALRGDGSLWQWQVGNKPSQVKFK